MKNRFVKKATRQITVQYWSCGRAGCQTMHRSREIAEKCTLGNVYQTRQQIAELAELQRRVAWRLVIREKKTIRDAAYHLGRHPSTVRSYLNRYARDHEYNEWWRADGPREFSCYSIADFCEFDRWRRIEARYYGDPESIHL